MKRRTFIAAAASLAIEPPVQAEPRPLAPDLAACQAMPAAGRWISVDEYAAGMAAHLDQLFAATVLGKLGECKR